VIHWWLAPCQRGLRMARARHACLRLEHLESRSLLTNSVVDVPSPAVAGGSLLGAAAIAATG